MSCTCMAKISAFPSIERTLSLKLHMKGNLNHVEVEHSPVSQMLRFCLLHVHVHVMHHPLYTLVCRRFDCTKAKIVSNLKAMLGFDKHIQTPCKVICISL